MLQGRPQGHSPTGPHEADLSCKQDAGSRKRGAMVSTLCCAAHVHGQSLRDHVERARDGHCAFLRKELSEPTGLGDLVDPASDDLEVPLLHGADSDHDHVQAQGATARQHLGDELAAGVDRPAANVVAVGEADEPARQTLGRQARLAQLVNAHGHCVKELRATAALRLHRVQLNLQKPHRPGLLRRLHYHLDTESEAADAHKVLVADLLPQYSPDGLDARAEARELRARVP
mmetsp:Transcript_26167/g.71096  ORF Transcript_26167/g.71096 Transcript_26167/m.71096 type:complete len:231 (-) Transcript_26167:101-793(-)